MSPVLKLDYSQQTLQLISIPVSKLLAMAVFNWTIGIEQGSVAAHLAHVILLVRVL